MDYTESKRILDSKEHDKYNLVKEYLENASSMYYNTDTVIMSDLEYDQLYQQYLQLTGEEIVGSLPKTDKGILNMKHEYKNLTGTLFKCKDINDFPKVIQGMINKLKPFSKFPTFLFTLKFDGNSVVTTFKDGKFDKAYTRGKDGIGLDLTNVFKSIAKDPLQEYDIKLPFAIRNEVIITYDNLEKLNDYTKNNYVNPRSATSGILGRDDAHKFSKFLTLVPLDIKFLDEDNYPFEITLSKRDNSFNILGSNSLIG
ncbi:DNA ligase [Listeria phage LPJP1]|nr:DNA ligase [Listeria phage LPJP1]